MPTIYSTYDAKARFSEIIRQVRSGKTILVSYRGELVAEVRPIQRGPFTIEERLDELERRGVLVRSTAPAEPIMTVARRPGALKRFLAERGE